jgi:hypothetical protein
MKRLALAALLLVPSLLIAEDMNLPPEMLCVKVKGMEARTYCGGGPIDYSQFPLPMIEDLTRNMVFLLGFDAANAYYPPPLTAQQEKQRELGRRVMEAAPYLIFPELGDPITKDTPAVAYCSSSTQKEPVDPWDSQNVKPTGKGRCQDLVIVYLRQGAK